MMRPHMVAAWIISIPRECVLDILTRLQTHTMKSFAALTTSLSLFACSLPAVAVPAPQAAAPVTDASVKTFFTSTVKLDEAAINKIKQFRGTQLACGALDLLRPQQLEVKSDDGFEKDRTNHW